MAAQMGPWCGPVLDPNLYLARFQVLQTAGLCLMQLGARITLPIVILPQMLLLPKLLSLLPIFSLMDLSYELPHPIGTQVAKLTSITPWLNHRSNTPAPGE